MTENEQRDIFEKWLSQYKGLLFKIVRAYAVAPSDQDDLFQEIVIQVWSSVPSFKGQSSHSTWIYRVSINTAIKWMTKERKRRQVETTGHIRHFLQENRVYDDERIEWLYEEIHQLNEIDRSIALLLLDGLSYKEMSKILGITESNVGVKINRIKKLLIAKINKNEFHGI